MAKYLITDRQFGRTARHYQESLRLPRCYQPTDTTAHVPPTPTRGGCAPDPPRVRSFNNS
jgi:predicted O-linked N-acetylglucosamine transferase (SPINDLY family)